MIKTYRFLPVFFVIILLVTIGGFYQSYFGFFPDFVELPFIMHLHAISFLIWFALLIIQPMLIRKKKLAWHRVLGKFSYGVVAVILFTILAMTKFSYDRELALHKSEAEILATLIRPFVDAIYFVGFYLAAVLNAKKLFVHISFIIATSLVIVEPAMGRMVPVIIASGKLWILMLMSVILYGIPLVLMVIEKIKFKRKMLTSPYLLIFVLMMFKDQILIPIGGESTLWHQFAKWMAMNFF